MRNTKPVYNTRFLASCSLKSHRAYFCTYHKHSLFHNSKRYYSNQTCFHTILSQNTPGVASYGCNRLQCVLFENAPDDLSSKMMQRTSYYATENGATDFLKIRVTTQRTNNIESKLMPNQRCCSFVCPA